MAPRGNPNPKGSKPDKLMGDAIRIALNREAVDAAGKKTKKLTLIADKLVDLAVEGDIAAIREVNDRTDGKATQPLDHGGSILEEMLERLSAGSTR